MCTKTRYTSGTCVNETVLSSALATFHVRKHEMGEACSTYSGEEKCVHGFSLGNMVEGDGLEDQAVDGKIILK